MSPRWQLNPRDPEPFRTSPDTTSQKAGLQCLKRDRHPGQTRSAGSDHALLDPVQTDVGKAQLAFRVGIDAAAFPGQVRAA